MEDKLIIAVANVPVLYDCTLFTYRDLNRRNQAWREVAETVGETDNVCKKRWKSLRDRFRKEKNMEKEAKRSGAGSAGGYKPWRFMAVMGFLTPFIIDRETSSNVPRQTLPPSTLVAEEESQVDSESASQSTSQSASQQSARRRMLRSGAKHGGGGGRCPRLNEVCCQQLPSNCPANPTSGGGGRGLAIFQEPLAHHEADDKGTEGKSPPRGTPNNF
ncbi:transcription factor Adf-1-like [Gymnodraco acuticeps]|uniref:Transcription factor Adf-1-like n=1 Tax=Gymnodraco acuticeps TaxID=8218 RepID=A0A6P8U4F5_GYMAC|nr:transcription factor Adf-1-like [Gymnodraco acuticeps]